MKRHTTARRHVPRIGNWVWACWQLAVVPSCVLSCAPAARYEAPSTLKGYEIVITRHDSLGRGIAEGLRHRGFSVRDHVRGGSGPTAYLFAFTFRELESPAVTWLHVRLADTRTGEVVAGVSAPIDSLGATDADRARAVVDSLAASPAFRRLVSPP
ncbi:MAG TPA: hypothetical protein VGV12_14560 [Gemmatimonadales bacterium]|nr:hypothetical protein [Gemmatimonadales bacterium]